jgi:stress response protein SCP2
LYHFDLTENFSVQTAVNVIEFSRSKSNPDEWTVKPVAEGFDRGLDGFIAMWGLAATRQ